MTHLPIDTVWQIGKDKRDRYMAEAVRTRRIRRRPPAEHRPGPPDRAA